MFEFNTYLLHGLELFKLVLSTDSHQCCESYFFLRIQSSSPEVRVRQSYWSEA